MKKGSGPDFVIPFQAAYSLLQDAASRDRSTARRTALTEILWHERYLDRENLMSRVGDRLGSGCFGDSAWEDTFNRDMQAVKDAFVVAGFRLGYSRTKALTGYYLRGEDCIHPDLRQAIAHSIAEIDLRQLSIYRSLGLAQRIRQALRASEQTRWQARYAHGSRQTGQADMALSQFISNLAAELETIGIVYAFGGTAAGWAWGEPRPAQQLDLILDLHSGQAASLEEHLRGMGLILSGGLTPGETAIRRRLVCIDSVHPGSDLRVRWIIPQPDDDLFHEALRRAVRLDGGRETGSMYVLSAEYLILQSLLDYSMDHDEASLRLISAVVFHREKNLDCAWISMQAEKRGWQRIWGEIALQTDQKVHAGRQDIV